MAQSQSQQPSSSASSADPQFNPVQPDPKYDHYDFPIVAAEPQSGHPGYTTPEQDAQVFQLRMMLEQEGYTERLDTLTLLRFLRARKFNVQASKDMFVASEKWRTEFGTNSLITDFEYPEKQEVFEYYPQFYHKTDKDGRPVYIEQLGGIDITAMLKITTSDRMLKHLCSEYEKLAEHRLPACSRKSGHLLETCCTIIDLKGVGITNASSVLGYLRQASGISQNYYPERLGKLYVINAPWGFSTVFSVVKGFLDPVTVNKIHVFGSGYERELLEQVPAENLPTQFGGTCECEEGCMFSDMGPWREAEFVNPGMEGEVKTEKKDKNKKEKENGAADATQQDPENEKNAEAKKENEKPAAATQS